MRACWRLLCMLPPPPTRDDSTTSVAILADDPGQGRHSSRPATPHLLGMASWKPGHCGASFLGTPNVIISARRPGVSAGHAGRTTSRATMRRRSVTTTGMTAYVQRRKGLLAPRARSGRRARTRCLSSSPRIARRSRNRSGDADQGHPCRDDAHARSSSGT